MNRPAAVAGSTAHFSIKAVSQATGLGVETLRAWERRYGVVRPTRDASGRRGYSASDVARLRLLRAATEAGHAISRLAGLDEDSLAKLVADSGGQARSGPTRGQSYVDRAIDAALNSDPTGVEETLASAIALLPPGEVVHTVMSPLIREVGDRWHRGELSIAQEHMVSDIARRLMISVARSYVRADQAPGLVLATLSGERHELGLVMCGWLAATRRYRTYHLGADCPPDQVARFALDVEARAALISVVMPEQIVPVHAQLRELASELANRCEVWIGGLAARQFRPEHVPPGCLLLPGPQDFEQRLDLLAAAEPY